MKISILVIATIFLMSLGLLSGNNSHPLIDMRPSLGGESGYYVPENPPPLDSTCIVFKGVDYGGSSSSPQNYVNSKHITNVMVGSYYFPVVIWETMGAWHNQSLFSYWDDMFNFWSYPDSFTSNYGVDTGRPTVCSDSKGNLHFSWHQDGSPDGYEVFYTRAILDTSAGIIQYNVERPAQFLSATNGDAEHFPTMAMYGDDLIMVIWGIGDAETGVGYNYSTDGGDTWAGRDVAYDHGGLMPGGWQLPNVAANPNNGDMWGAITFDYTGNLSMDLFVLHWDASTNTWDTELAHESPIPPEGPYALPAVVVDYNDIPHIIFQENLIEDGGISGSLSGWSACGPSGTLFYTYRMSANNWSTPDTIKFPRYEICNYASGTPSAGIATDNTIYFTTTQPESAEYSDMTAWYPFNLYYGEISPYTGALSCDDTTISKIAPTDSNNAIYGHITYHVPPEGPGITWCQLINATIPADVYYNHSDTLVPVEEKKTISSPSPITLYQNYPNPAREKTMIRFTVPNNTNISLNIYDISGRLVRTLANGIPGASSSFVVWNGKNGEGKEVPGGVYLYTLKAGAYTETRKLLLIN